MDGNDQTALDQALTGFAERVFSDERLVSEVRRARREFFGETDAATSPGAAAERRFLEWYLLERESEVLGEVPCDVARLDVPDSVLGSLVGAFQVVGVATDCATGKDLQDGTMLELVVPTGSLEVGDLMVGRLYAVGTGRYLPSTVASVFRPGGSLGQAFSGDVERLDLGRRLQQVELEHVLLRPQERAAAARAAEESVGGRAHTAPLEHLEADLERLLQSLPKEYSATAISERLAAAARPGPVLGPLLDELAFETDADLDAARKTLLAIWNAHHADDPPADAAPESGPPGETLGERMVRALDAGLQSESDIDGVFAELEEMAGLEPGSADDGENPFDREPGDDGSTRRTELAGESEGDAGAGGAGEPVGDLSPLVEEFVWETSPSEPITTTLRTWVTLQSNAAVPRSDLELVTGEDLTRLLLHVFLSAAPPERAAATRTAHGALVAFYDWLHTEHQIDLREHLAPCREVLLEPLDRLAGAGVALSTAEAPTTRPAMFELEAISSSGFGVRTEDGDGEWCTADAHLTEQLREGDLVLGALGAGPRFFGPVVVLPAAARTLME
ncbi:MAG: hypothetical protein NXI31_26100 [bacterium]|nr:hypothetical protein [bacterium]